MYEDGSGMNHRIKRSEKIMRSWEREKTCAEKHYRWVASVFTLSGGTKMERLPKGKRAACV